MKTRILMLVFAFGLLSVALGCVRMQELSSYCMTHKCPSCTSDSECVIVTNPCYAHASCAHKKSNLAVTLLGCTREYKVPPKESCRCINGICSAVE